MNAIGLKIWSINLNYINEVLRLYDQGFCDYVELFAVPGTFCDVAVKWAELKIPYTIHAPHSMQGVNFAIQNFESNQKLILETLKFADKLNSENIILHPGVNGNLTESAKQIKKIFDTRMLIENKPYFSCDGKFVCNGYSPQQIKFLIQETGVGFCLDFAHAIFAANALKKDKIEFIREFMDLSPKMFHITDGQWTGHFDEHPNLGHGNFDFDKLQNFFLPNSKITIETKHNFESSLDDFETDVLFLKKFLQ